MERFYLKFQSQRYPALFNGLVILGIRLRLLSRVILASLVQRRDSQ
jgi:hypothetical protein